MACKHKSVIRIVNSKKEYYCIARQKEISEWECERCPLKLETNSHQGLIDLFFGGQR